MSIHNVAPGTQWELNKCQVDDKWQGWWNCKHNIDGVSQLQIIFLTADLNVKVKTLAHTMIKNSNNYICINSLIQN